MLFNPQSDPIAITVPRLAIVKTYAPNPIEAIFEGTTSEPYLVTLAVDANNVVQKSLELNMACYPNMRPMSAVDMLGHGHLVYGPRNPGAFVTASILVMESDRDINEVGATLEDLLGSEAAKLGVKALMAANPGATAIISIVQKLAELLGRRLRANKDDHLLTVHGTYLQGAMVPYDVNRMSTHKNDYVEIAVKCMPLSEPNGQGPSARTIQL